ncbi:MAG: hypothetical protein QOF02_3136 [Blastocatellia bacterium]|jgi:hypothetical protein|nr:hypothetical protein [Blastocatellia bacterium]
MSINESSATALVRFTGLGIICFNDERGRGEIAAIRDDKHLLSIKIQQPVYQDGGEHDIIVYQDVAAYHKLQKEDVQIEIKAVGAPAIEGFEIYQSGDFDRLDSADVNDFRWVVNLSALHDDLALSPVTEERHPLTKIYIGNGLFYTHKLDTEMFFEKVETSANGEAPPPEVFGNVAETIGVKIEGAAVSFTIRIGDKEETRTLQRVEGLPFRIEIKNMDYSENAVYSDMADYYGYLSSPSGARFDLIPVIEDGGGQAASGGSINQKQFCHPIASDFSSIDEL